MPDICVPVVDVADVFAMHVRALERPDSIGKRHIGADRTMSTPEIAAVLAQAYPDRKIATRVAPKWLLRILALFDGGVRSILPQVDMAFGIRNDRAQQDLGVTFVPAEETILASARFLDQKAA